MGITHFVQVKPADEEIVVRSKSGEDKLVDGSHTVDQEARPKAPDADIEVAARPAEELDTVETLLQSVGSPDSLHSQMMGDAPFCDHCGHITVRNGACYKCLNCGNSMGCS